jgi:hypothetical protein
MPRHRAGVEQRVKDGRPLWVHDATCGRCGWTRPCGGWRAAAAALREHRDRDCP